MKTKLTLILAAITLVFSAACAEEKNKEKAMETAKEAPQEPTEKIVKTDEEWKKILTPEHYRILRPAGTGISALALVYEVVVNVAVWPCGAGLAEDAVLLGSEDFF
ncbi:MAG: hypothetical protein ACK47H_08975, partial [Akkermansiaceae bacterium]